MRRRDLERAREVLRDSINRSEAPYTSLYISRIQARALLDAADAALAAQSSRYQLHEEEQR